MDENRRKKKSHERTTEQQIYYYLKFRKQHPELNRHAPKAVIRDLWSDLARNLNAMNGPKRTAVKWRENMSQWRKQKLYRARRAGREVREELEKTPIDAYYENETDGPLKTMQDYDKIDEDEVDTLGIDDEFTYVSDTAENELCTYNTAVDVATNRFSSITGSIITEELQKKISMSFSQHDTPRSGSTSIQSTNKNEEMDKIVELILESVQQREKREERALGEQKRLTDALIALTNAIQNLSDKLDNT